MKGKKIYENIKFQRGLNPKSAMDIGLSKIIRKWLEEHEIFSYRINEDNTIEVHGDVELYHINLNNLPDYIQFEDVHGNFDISGNNLTSLRGVPKYIHGNFNFSGNKIESLKYCPIFVGGDFDCSYNDGSFNENHVRSLCIIHGYFLSED